MRNPHRYDFQEGMLVRLLRTNETAPIQEICLGSLYKIEFESEFGWYTVAEIKKVTS